MAGIHSVIEILEIGYREGINSVMEIVAIRLHSRDTFYIGNIRD